MTEGAAVVSVNVSKEKGTIKVPVNKITLNHLGIATDAHAGEWHRQLSLLAQESITRFETKLKRKIEHGEFAENITTQNIVLHETVPGDKLQIGQTLLEITQIGKKCHGSNCAIFQQVGSCVMPTEGVFARVIEQGTICPGDSIKLIKKDT